VCDQTIAKADDSCAAEGMMACSTDGTELLHCRNGTMVVDRMCRGEHGCSRESPNAPPTCDAGLAQIGDPCTSTGSRCSTDGKSILTCSQETHHMILDRTCRGAKGCFRDAHSHLAPGWDFLSCDVSVGEAGQPCFGYTGVGQKLNLATATCSTDGKELLVCNSGTLVHRFSCNCAVHWSSDSMYYGAGCTDPPPAGEIRIANYIQRSGTIRLVADQPN
jgi:hypothetical protein